MAELWHARRSQYSGGFKVVNGRKNNTSEYNHNYYEKNKQKWRKYSHKTPYTSAQNDPHNKFDHVTARGYYDGYTGEFHQQGLEYYNERHPSDRLTVRDHYTELDVPNWLSSYGAKQETLDNGRQIYVDNYRTKYVGKLEQVARRGKRTLNYLLKRLDTITGKVPAKGEKR